MRWRYGLLVLALSAALGQESGQPVRAPGENLRLWVVSQPVRICGTAVPLSAVQPDVENHLRAAGLAVSRVRNAELTLDLNCSPPVSSGWTTDMRACVSFSPAGAAAPQWRKCESFTCKRQECEGVVRSGVNSLVDWFVLSRELEGGTSTVTVTQTVTQTVTGPSRAASRTGGPELASVGPDPSPAARMLFYGSYILVGLAVLTRWRRYQGRRC